MRANELNFGFCYLLFVFSFVFHCFGRSFYLAASHVFRVLCVHTGGGTHRMNERTHWTGVPAG